jgi:hypothetical protein
VLIPSALNLLIVLVGQGPAEDTLDPLRSSREGAVVWELPYRPAWQDHHAPYYVHAYRENR